MPPRLAKKIVVATPQPLEELRQCLPDSHQLIVHSTAACKATLLDTFDNALWRRGQVLLRTPDQLLLFGEESPGCTLERGHAVEFKADIPDARLQQALESVSGLRRLLPEYTVQLTLRQCALLDEEAKTCVRLELWEVASAQSQASYVVLKPLRGYQAEHRLLCDALYTLGGNADTGMAGLFGQLGYGGHHYQSHPAPALDADAPVKEAVVLLLATYLDVARRNEQGIIQDLDSEFLHDYRVSLRRVRSLLALCKDVLDPLLRLQLKKRCSNMMRQTNRLRDLDVYLLGQETYYQLLPKTMHPGVDQIFSAFKSERAQAHRQLSKHLRSAAYLEDTRQLQEQLLDKTGQQLPSGPLAEMPTTEYARQLIDKHYKRLCRMAAGINADTPDDDVHDLRLQCKKLRYLLDFFRPILDRRAVRKIIKALKGLQDNLGRFNDYSSQQISLRLFLDEQLAGKKTTNPDMIEAVGALIAIKHQLQLKERAQVMANCRDFSGAETRRLVKSITGNTLREKQAP